MRTIILATKNIFLIKNVFLVASIIQNTLTQKFYQLSGTKIKTKVQGKGTQILTQGRFDSGENSRS
ncbi:hypothetical protein LAT59_02000 [Candidatus Gracilibacteria bacterium]|nr:hypothetical protein [Candidatus Gracilibacteria bacterium]